MLKKILLFLSLSSLSLNTGLRMNKVSIGFKDESGLVKEEYIDHSDPLYNLVIQVARRFLPEGPLHSIQVFSNSPSDYLININFWYPNACLCDDLGPRGTLFGSLVPTLYRHLSPVYNSYESIKNQTDLSRDAYFERITEILNAWKEPMLPELVIFSGQPNHRTRASSWFYRLFV